MRVVKETTRGPFSERLMGRSKSNYMLMKELPQFIERAVAMKLETRLVGSELEFGEGPPKE